MANLSFYKNWRVLMKKIIIISSLVLTFFGCSSDSVFEGLSDDSSFEATLEEAAMALDDENYDDVVNLLTEYYTTTALNPDVARLLVSGYMGKAGIDVISFITYSADIEADSFDSVGASLSLSPRPPNAECNAFDRTVLGISGDAVYIYGNCIGELIEYMDNAKEIIYDLQGAGMESTEDLVQLGITSAAHYVFIVGNETKNALSTPFDPVNLVPVTKEAYRLFKSSGSYDWDVVNAAYFAEADDDGDGLTRYQKDLVNVNDAILAINQAISEPNVIRDELDEFLREVLMTPTGDITDDTIIQIATSTGIYSHINSM
jgi:hypothetical protein